MTSKNIGTGSSVTYVAGDPAFNPPENPPPYEARAGIPGPAPPPQPQQTIIVNRPGLSTTIINYGTNVGPKPSTMRCPSCNIQMVSKTKYKPALRAHLAALGFCLLGLWPCVFIPYCVETCNNVDHYCANCNAYIGTYPQLHSIAHRR